MQGLTGWALSQSRPSGPNSLLKCIRSRWSGPSSDSQICIWWGKLGLTGCQCLPLSRSFTWSSDLFTEESKAITPVSEADILLCQNDPSDHMMRPHTCASIRKSWINFARSIGFKKGRVSQVETVLEPLQICMFRARRHFWICVRIVDPFEANSFFARGTAVCALSTSQ